MLLSGNNKCQTCGRPIILRCGVLFTPLLALIYDKVEMSGSDGVEGNFLRNYVQNVTSKKTGDKSLTMSIRRINKLFENAGKPIRIKNYRQAAGTYKRGDKSWIHFYYIEKQ